MQWTKKNSRRVFYFYLAQLLFSAVYLIYAPSGARALLGAALLIVFGVCYSFGYFTTGVKRFWFVMGQIVIIWLLAWWLSPGYFAILYYPVATLSFMSRRSMVWGFGILAAGSAVELGWLLRGDYHADLLMYAPVAASICFGILSMSFMIRSFRKLGTANEKLARANAQIERLTKGAERDRISRDLHDVMGHQLSMITLKAQVAAKLLARGHDEALALAEVQDIERAAREALTQVREYVADMRQPDFLDEWSAAQTLLTAANIDCTFALGDVSCMEGAVYQVMAMCLREAVTNIVRHSAARKAWLGLEVDEDGFVHLCIADDGRGFEQRHIASVTAVDGSTSGGNGIKGMRARVAAVGGQMHLWDKGCGAMTAPAQLRALPWQPSVVVHIVAPEDEGKDIAQERVQ